MLNKTNITTSHMLNMKIIIITDCTYFNKEKNCIITNKQYT